LNTIFRGTLTFNYINVHFNEQVSGGNSSSPLLALLLELYEARAAEAGSLGDAPIRDVALAECNKALAELEIMDSVRISYWQRRRNRLARLAISF